MIEIPYWEKYMLTLREAAEYFHIGEKKMRQIVDENMDAKFLLDFVMITRTMVEIAGKLSYETDHPRMKWLKKAACCVNNGQDVFTAGFFDPRAIAEFAMRELGGQYYRMQPQVRQ